jgi:hypothetical protein
VKSFYTAPTATVEASPPNAPFHALVCPGAPAWSIVVVDCWPSARDEDAWEELPQVKQHYPEDLGGTIPQSVAAFGPWGATTGMTYREAFRIIRRMWPQWRD